MTNLEYIKSILDDRGLADLVCNPWLETKGFRSRVMDAFDNWKMSLPYNNNSNTYSQHKEKNPNPFEYELMYNEDTSVWEHRGRKHNVAFQVWLIGQYNPDEWTKKENK